MNKLELVNKNIGIDIARRDDLSESIPMHRHSFHEMVYIFTGKGIHELEDGDYEINPGDLLIVPPGAAHAYRERCQMSLVNIMFDLKKIPFTDSFFQESPVFRALFLPAPELTGKFRFRNRLTLFDEDREKSERIIHELVFESTSRKICWEANLHSLLIRLLVYLLRVSESNRYSGPGNLVLLDKIIDSMRSRLRSRIVIPDIAVEFGLSQRNLERLFLNAVQCTPLAYLNGLRLKEAERLLAETGKPIGEVSDCSGFSDSNYFAKIFRKKHQASPRDFRKKYAVAKRLK